ncbi:putative inorganic phosphate cotransporter [Anthonomus grandis grandis]|uniref:putative inorganic phosphate cotransporter n=1 Tax=Anthonomus grandis grandis TaxID=2921223 RepID=UPI0021666C5C|nr:putative inorganic phosphate cotransporter [Anthonomus grandis grandis]
MQKDNSTFRKENMEKGPKFGKRHVQAILLFTGVATELMTRITLSLSIVAMTDSTASVNDKIPTYTWKDRDVILSSFYWGYLVLLVAAGQAAKQYGPKWILFTALTVNSCATALIPLAAAYLGSKGVMACRIMQGISQGGVYPSVHTMLGRWAPQNERGRMSTFVYSGISIASIVCLPVTGAICKSYLGWPVSLYLFGGCGFLWSILWLFFGHNSPATHPTISTAERRYIEESLAQAEETEVIPTPWKAILSSPHVWALVIPTAGSGYAVIFLQNEMPTYLKTVMNYDVDASGYLSSLTSVIGVVGIYIYGPLSDFLIEKRYLSRTNTRKFFEVYACYGSAASLLVLAYLKRSQEHLAVYMIAVANVFGSGILFGHSVNPIDLSPRFSGIIVGLANSMSSIAALCAPLSVQYIVTDQTNPLQWRIVFIIAAIGYVLPATAFILFASAERQWWDDGAVKDSTTNQARVKKISTIEPEILRKFSTSNTVQI